MSAQQPQLIYVLFDGRANTMPTDECTVIEVAHSPKEVKESSRANPGDCVWFTYGMSKEEILINEQCLGRCDEINQGLVSL